MYDEEDRKFGKDIPEESDLLSYKVEPHWSLKISKHGIAHLSFEESKGYLYAASAKESKITCLCMIEKELVFSVKIGKSPVTSICSFYIEKKAEIMLIVATKNSQLLTYEIRKDQPVIQNSLFLGKSFISSIKLAELQSVLICQTKSSKIEFYKFTKKKKC